MNLWISGVDKTEDVLRCYVAYDPMDFEPQHPSVDKLCAKRPTAAVRSTVLNSGPAIGYADGEGSVIVTNSQELKKLEMKVPESGIRLACDWYFEEMEPIAVFANPSRMEVFACSLRDLERWNRKLFEQRRSMYELTPFKLNKPTTLTAVQDNWDLMALMLRSEAVMEHNGDQACKSASLWIIAALLAIAWKLWSLHVSLTPVDPMERIDVVFGFLMWSIFAFGSFFLIGWAFNKEIFSYRELPERYMNPEINPDGTLKSQTAAQPKK